MRQNKFYEKFYELLTNRRSESYCGQLEDRERRLFHVDMDKKETFLLLIAATIANTSSANFYQKQNERWYQKKRPKNRIQQMSMSNSIRQIVYVKSYTSNRMGKPYRVSTSLVALLKSKFSTCQRYNQMWTYEKCSNIFLKNTYLHTYRTKFTFLLNIDRDFQLNLKYEINKKEKKRKSNIVN